MERLRLDDPERVGPYRIIGRLDPEYAHTPVPTRRYIARDVSGNRTVVVTLPRNEAADDREHWVRFAAEAENARRIRQAYPFPWIWAIDEVAGEAGAEPPWYAAPYLPALPLPTALELYGAPLPEETVRALGAALAETLAALHAEGQTHAGVAPGAVLVAGDGPRLTGFGDVRAAAVDGTPRRGLPGLAADFLPPEQLTGGRPRPLGDVYALGAVLTYAATGRTVPEAGLLPAGLRSIVTACLAADPADRPQARDVVTSLVRGGRQPVAVPSVAAPVPTSFDATADRAASLLGPGWLPGRLIAAIAEQSAEVLAAETDVTENEAATAAVARAGVHPATETDRPATALTGPPVLTSPDRQAAHSPHTVRTGAAGAQEALTTPGDAGVSATRSSLHAAFTSLNSSRRALLLGAAAGAAGVAIGGGAVWGATAPDPDPPTEAERLAAAHRTRHRLKGAPPQPRWRHDLTGPASYFPPYIWRQRVAVVSGRTTVAGLDMRTGKQLWNQDAVRPTGTAVAVGEDLLLVPGLPLTVLDARTGKVAWQAKRYGKGGKSPFEQLLAMEQNTVWFAAGGEDGTQRVTVAYDIRRREEIWRSPLPPDFIDGRLTDDALVVTSGTSPGKAMKKTGGEALRSIVLNRRNGVEHDTVTYDGAEKGQPVAAQGSTLIVGADDALRGYELGHGGAAKWSVRRPVATRRRVIPPFGPPTVHDGTVYAADAWYMVHAVAAATGDIRWQREHGFRMPGMLPPPNVVVSPSGRTIVMAGIYEIDAFDTSDGALRWRFADLNGSAGAPLRRRVALTDEMAVVLSGRTVYALPTD
ncbi:PQQ-binding-like beta-propeller repeat protein [Streptomyces olivaceiscleroticus]|uniref:Protein kinase domain-containing protein n=1 Tax=Streptomyces olivaceiscleroticus TaxID=68245 RepID=A0ABP3JNZ3_9ACTN